MDHSRDHRETPVRISVIIVNWNRSDLLAQCLESIEPALGGGSCEIIVVDNASSDGSAEMVTERFPAVKLVANTDNRGFARATNQGFALCRGKYALLVNSDTTASRHALERMADYMDDDPAVAVLGCRVTYPDGTPQNSCFRFPSLTGVALNAVYLSHLFRHSELLNWDRYGRQTWDDVREVDCVMGGFMMVRSSSVDGMEFLDEGYFMYGEEADLCYRLKQRGGRVVYYPGATIIHHHGGSTRGLDVATWAYGARQRAILRFLRKWRGSPVALVANSIILLGLVPRTVSWVLADLYLRLTGRSEHVWRLSRRVAGAPFHLASLFRPRLLDRNWEPPWARSSIASSSAGEPGD